MIKLLGKIVDLFGLDDESQTLGRLAAAQRLKFWTQRNHKPYR